MNPNRAAIIAGNWKMNGSLAANASLLDGIQNAWSHAQSVRPNCEVLVCAPTAYLDSVARHISSAVTASSAAIAIRLGSQDVSAHTSGAFTGECSGAMLREVGCSYVIVGHSERRQYHTESDATVAAKAKAALASGLRPIVCVGETLIQRDAGEAIAVVRGQLQAVIDALAADLAKIIVAYEPVWAIGTGRTATPEQAQEIHSAIRSQLETHGAEHVSVLYGGSMNAGNASSLLAQPDIDGGLIGGAALKPADFTHIILAAHQQRQHPAA